MSEPDRFDGARESETPEPAALVPDVEVPETPDESDVDPAVARTFWRLVLVFNVALFGMLVGPMVQYFLDRPLLAGGLMAVGIVAAAYGLGRYRQFKRERIEED